MHKRCIPPFQEIIIKIEKKKTQTNSKPNMSPNHLHESQSTARRAHAGCVASLGQLSIRWKRGMIRCLTHATPGTSLLTQHQDRGVRRRRRSRHFYVTITRSCEYKCKKATVWPRYPESTSCQAQLEPGLWKASEIKPGNG